MIERVGFHEGDLGGGFGVVGGAGVGSVNGVGNLVGGFGGAGVGDAEAGQGGPT